MELCIERCIAEFDKLSLSYDEIDEDNITQFEKTPLEINIPDLLQFQQVFFVEMNNALFNGEYLSSGYINKIAEFENKVVQYNQTLYGSLRCALQGLRDLVLEIRGIVDRKHPYLAPSYSTSNNFEDFLQIDFWTAVSLRLAYIDHTLICNTQYRDELVRLIIKILEKIEGITDSKQSGETYKKLLVKAAFLLKKIWMNDNDVELSISAASKIYEVKDIIAQWGAEMGDFFKLYDNLYPNLLPRERLDDYEAQLKKKNYSLQLFVILAYNYATTNKENKCSVKYNLKELRELSASFQEYKRDAKGELFDKYALWTVDSFIQNCHFSLFTRSEECTITSLRDELENVKQVEAKTGIRHYHPYKKALNFLKSRFQELEKGENEIAKAKECLELYNLVYKRYVENYDACIREHLYPFQLTVSECIVKTDHYGEMFIASSLARPIIPRKLKDAEREFRELKLYGRVSVQVRERQFELQKLVDETNDKLIGYRKEIFEYIGVFIAIATILFGGVQHFLQVKSAQASIRNFLSIGILLALFMLVLYFVVYKREKSFRYLIAFIGLCIVLLFFTSYISALNE